MTNRPYLIAEATWKTVRDTQYEVAVLPWGATEAHNYHLPYATDIIQCDHIATESGRIAWEAGAKVAVLPTIPFGVNTGQLDIRLDINMNPSTQMAVLSDVAISLTHQGISKLVILNGHGGNDFRQMCREVQTKQNIFLATIDWYKVLDAQQYFDEPGDHAGEMETSLMMHIAPHLVLPLSEAGSGAENKFKVAAFSEGWAWTERQWRQATIDTGVGNPAASTAEKGEHFFEALTNKIAAFLIDLSQVHLDDLYQK